MSNCINNACNIYSRFYHTEITKYKKNSRHQEEILITSHEIYRLQLEQLKGFQMTKKMTQILTALFATVAAMSFFNVVGAAETIKEKSVKTVVEIPQQCKDLFSEAENLIAEAEKQPGTHPQVNKIRSKLNQSKKQILEMELATQIKSCDVALAKLNSMKQQQQQTQ